MKRNVLVLGAGVMGVKLALLCSIKGFNVILWNDVAKDLSILYKQTMIDAVSAKYAKNITKQALDRIFFSTNLKDELDVLRDCDVVIESIVENLIEKEKIFNDLYKSENKKYLIFTNTSSFSISKLQRNCNLPIIGTHFFNSPLRSTIVEICFGDLVCTELRSRTLEFLEALDYQSVIVKDRPGFVVNKALFAYLAEAIRIFDEENITINEFEKLFTIGAGMPCGPLKLVELIGVDTTVQILHSIYESTGDMHYKPSKLLEHMIKSNRLGKKNGRGFVEPEVGTFLI